MSQPDFFQPGDDGALPDGFIEWQRGLTYTVHPVILEPLRQGHHYRINATVRRTIAKGETFTYDEVYERATAIANARIAELQCASERAPLHTWILAQAWFRHELGAQNLVSATITKGLVCTQEETARPRGEDVPAAALLATPSGGVPEAFAAKHRHDTGERYVDEFYVDFDMSDPSGAGRDITLSYGEYVTACRGVNFEPFVRRAESRARFHCQWLTDAPSETRPLRVVRREWTCLATNKKTDPHMVVVHLLIRL